MTRKRAPPKRPGSTTQITTPRKNSDTKRTTPSSTSFGADVDVGGYMRAILLGALVGGVVAFLFYPDISRVLERWNNSSDDLGLQTQNEVKGHAERDTYVHAGKADPKKHVQKAATEKESAATKASRSNSNEGSSKSQEKSRPKQCVCKKPAPQPKCGPAASRKKSKTKPATEKSPPKEDLMEEEDEEEEIVEEDSVEVELMEEEEVVEYIELKEEEEDEEAVLSESAQTLATEDSTPELSEASDRAKEEMDDPGLEDEQTITFTPVSEGAENILRLGGRPKTKESPSTGGKGGAVGKSTDGTSNLTKQKPSVTPETSDKASEKKAADETADTKSLKTKQQSKQMKKRSAKSKREQKVSEQTDIPDEVKRFQPTYLKTVAAKKIFADGRRIPPVELIPQKETNSSVRVFLFNEFLSEAECDGLRRVHDKHVNEMSSQPLLCFDSLSTLRKHLGDVNRTVHVTPNDFVQGTKCLNSSFSRRLGRWMSGNWSYSTAFYPGESRFSNIFEARVMQAMGLEPNNGGKFQITSYPTGKAYKAHTDCMLEGGDLRDRVATVLVYLDDVQDGGETKFPELGIWVKPRKGRALVWNNMSPEGLCEPHSLHVASKVISGSKYILIRWYYYKSFYSLGKRPPEPPLPARPDGTPRVSCDDYDNGSCRWYDEWNNDHLLDYEYKKYTLV